MHATDAQAPAAASPPHAPPTGKPLKPEKRVKMTRLRMRVAERLKGAQNTYAMLTTFNEVDMTSLMEMRNSYKVCAHVCACVCVRACVRACMGRAEPAGRKQMPFRRLCLHMVCLSRPLPSYSFSMQDAFLDRHGIKLGFMSAFVKASAVALAEVPAVNAVIDEDEIVYR
jgi:2-oxoglutarate dehydrogenase E2 component (dihydrolipoamide succinyltransferase)